MATFGKTTDGSASSSSTSERKQCSIASPASNGTATKITVRAFLSSAGSSKIRGFIYSNTSNNPDALLAISDDVTITNTTNQEIDCPFSGANQITVTSGTSYWIGFHQEVVGGVAVNQRRDGTAAGQRRSTGAHDTFSDGTSDPFGAISEADGPITAYVTYTEGGATAVKDIIGSGIIPFAR